MASNLRFLHLYFLRMPLLVMQFGPRKKQYSIINKQKKPIIHCQQKIYQEQKMSNKSGLNAEIPSAA